MWKTESFKFDDFTKGVFLYHKNITRKLDVYIIPDTERVKAAILRRFFIE